MKQVIRVLLVEDSIRDAELLLRELDRAGFDAIAHRVDSEADFIAALNDRVDLILSDHQLPRFSGLRALAILNKGELEIPFILVSGTIGEEVAVSVIQLGAADYLLKDRLTRLGPAVTRAIEQSRLRKEHRRMVDALRESEERLQLASQVGGVGTFELDHGDGKVYASAVLVALMGIPPGQEVQPFSPERAVEEDRLGFLRKLAEAHDPAGAGRLDHQYRIQLDDGAIRWLRVISQTWFQGEGASRRPSRSLGTLQDITVHKEGEAAQQERHRLAAQLVETAAAAPGLMFALRVKADGALSFPYISEKVQGLLGLDPTELGRSAASFLELVHPDDIEELNRAIQNSGGTAGSSMSDFRIRTPAAGMIWMAGNGTARRDPAGGWLLHGFLLDITARKLGEFALRETEERFRQLAENIHEVFWMSNPETAEILYISPAYQNVWGRTCASLYADSKSWVDAIHPDDRQRVREAASTKQVTGEYSEVFRIIRPDGSVRWVHDTAFPVKNATGAVYRVVGTAEDITERKQLEAQFLRTQRLEAIGTLSSGIAHDLNNILAPTMMVVSLLRDKLKDPSDREMLGMVEQGAQRGANIIKQLLTFSRGIGGDRGVVQTRHLLKEMTVLMRETFPREIKIVDDTPSDLPPVIADATQLSQVLMNLCVNARDSMPAGGRLTVSARRITLNDTQASLYERAKPGPYVVLSVADTGLGIPPELMDRIFEPFFTTKDVGKGTGLGLSTVMGIVKSHGGFVTVQGGKSGGSVFEVYLPATGTERDDLVPTAPLLTDGRGQLILVVDDEASIRQTVAYTLTRNRFRVLTASDGREGLTTFVQHRAHIRLVLTDVMMPVMSGVSLIRAIRALEPMQRIVAMSGLSDETRRAELAELGVVEILEKPCSPADLLGALHRELPATG